MVLVEWKEKVKTMKFVLNSAKLWKGAKVIDKHFQD